MEKAVILATFNLVEQSPMISQVQRSRASLRQHMPDIDRLTSRMSHDLRLVFKVFPVGGPTTIWRGERGVWKRISVMG